MKIKRFFPQPALLACLVATILSVGAKAHVAETDWATSEGGRMRIVTLAPDDKGIVKAVLQVDLTPGWITYWREPGGSGIPPQITPAAGSKAEVTGIEFPVPKHIRLGDIDDIAYDEPVTLPFTIALNGEADTLDLSAFIGVCREICVPFQSEFKIDVAAAGHDTSAEEAIIRDAEAKMPAAPGPDFNIASFKLSPDRKALHLTLTLPSAGNDAPEVIATGPAGYVFADVRNGHRDGTTYAADLNLDYLPDGYDFKGSQWRVLVKSGDRAIETSLAFH
jgi:DsbC/DsbD-like thiol-disulfide interchange protein